MSAMEIRLLKEILEKEIDNCSTVFIIGHNSPDFDSIGSCIGLYFFAKHYGKNVYIIIFLKNNGIRFRTFYPIYQRKEHYIFTH